MKSKAVAVFTALLLLTGCQATSKVPLSPSDFTISASKVKTKEALIGSFLPKGYQITRDSEFQLVLDRPAKDNLAAQVLLGSQFNSVPNARVTLTITGDNPTQVNSRIAIVTNPGSGFEQVMDLDQNADARSAVALAILQAKNNAEAAPAKPAT